MLYLQLATGDVRKQSEKIIKSRKIYMKNYKKLK